MHHIRRWLTALAAFGISLAAASVAFAQQPSGPPIRIGGTLALTGPLASTGLIHKLAGEIYVESLNRRGGLLGRPVEWILRDDQSRPDIARTMYEQLVTVDKVDLLMGPYATANILSAMGVAQRFGKVLVHHSFGIPSLAKYDLQFPTFVIGPDPGTTFPTKLLDALAASPTPPKTIAVVTSKFPSVHFMSQGAREVAKKRGLREVLFLEWDFGNRDFGPIASRLKEARPDFVWVGAIGLEGNLLLDAARKIDYVPPLHFHLYPAPGVMAKSADSANALALTLFESHPPFTNDPVAAEFVRVYTDRATKANFPDTSVETQAAGSFMAWQVLEAGVRGTNSLDDKAIGAFLKRTPVPTIAGTIRFDGPNNFVDDLTRVKQVQNGRWVVVWPPESAAPGAKLLTR